MNVLQRLIRADNTRITRFHTSNGHLCLSPREFLRSLATTVNRIVWHRYAKSPWLVFPAIDYVKPRIAGKRIFEFGSGMSTLWFAKSCRQIVSVEDDSFWYQAVKAQSRSLTNVRIIHALSKADYVAAVAAAGGSFDLILIDGLYRIECLEAARPHLAPAGLLVVDDTDAVPGLDARVEQLFGDRQILRFRGWVSGNLHPHETTIVRHDEVRPAG